MPFGVGKTPKSSIGDNSNTITLLPARVLGVIITPDEYPEEYKKYGEYSSLGGILFEFFNNSTGIIEPEKGYFALPYSSNHKAIPQKNEIVSIIALPDPTSTGDKSGVVYYYMPPVNIWNSPHVNTLPDETLTKTSTPTTQQKDYTEVSLGSPNRLLGTPTVLEYDNGFKEQSNIRNITYYPGDNILEGSFGNHIRLGSTCVRDSLPNTWSTAGIGSNGDPILTIQNGQYPTSNSPWEPLSENINLDNSSIYLTSTQKINIETPSYLNASYNGEDTPVDPNQFTQPQVILNSNRVALFGRDYLVGSASRIHLSGGTINFDTPGIFTVYASRVNLGSGNPDDLQPALKGDQTQALLDEILVTLKKLVEACATATGTVPIASLQKFAVENIARVQKLDTSTIKSDDTFIV